MKLFMVIFALFMSVGITNAANTYTWNQTTNALWTTSTNWTPNRTTPANTDILVFNNGGTYIVTSVTVPVTVGKIQVSGNTNLTLNLNNASNAVLTISGGTDALTVEAGSTLAISGSTGCSINIATGSTSSIYGNLSVGVNGNNTYFLSASDAGAIHFKNGSICTENMASGNPFGTLRVSSVIFESGARFLFTKGGNPFGASDPNAVLVFQSGSTYEQISANAPVLQNQTYANFVFNSSSPLSSTGSSPWTVDSISILQSTLTFNSLTGGIRCKGSINISSGSSLIYSPTSAATLSLQGSSEQKITNSGTLTLGANCTLAIANSAGVTLNSNVTVQGTLDLTSGVVTTGAKTISVANNAAGAIVRTSGWINGNLKRAQTNAIRSYLFPVGSALNYRGATVSFTAAPTISTNITACFNESDPLNIGLPYGYISCWNGGYWTISSDGTPNGTYSLSLDISGVSGTDANTVILKRQNNSVAWAVGGSYGSFMNNTITHTGLTSFSEFTLGSSTEGSLPVELTSFIAKVKVNQVVLTWNTATEVNNSFFTVERTKKSFLKNWKEIAQVRGAGNSNSPKNYSFTDMVSESGDYTYRLVQHDNDGTKQIMMETSAKVSIPLEFTLEQNYPNPFNPSTDIHYSVPEDTRVNISVFAVTGQLIKTLVDEYQNAGYHTIRMDASKMSSGTYIYQMNAGNTKLTKKLVILK